MIAGSPYRTPARVPEETLEPSVDQGLVRRRWRRYRRVTVEYTIVLSACLITLIWLVIEARRDHAYAMLLSTPTVIWFMWARVQFCRCPHCNFRIVGGPRIANYRNTLVGAFPPECTHCGTQRGCARPPKPPRSRF